MVPFELSRGVETTSIRSIIGIGTSAVPSTLWPDCGPSAAWSNSVAPPPSLRNPCPGGEPQRIGADAHAVLVAVEQLHLVFEMQMPADGDLRGVGGRQRALRLAPEPCLHRAPGRPAGIVETDLQRSGRPGVTRTGSLNVTVNTIVSYEWYVSPDCGADATTTEVTVAGGGGAQTAPWKVIVASHVYS